MSAPRASEPWVEAGFEPVAECFARNFEVLGDVGAAFAATLDGELVVDLWGGIADPQRGSEWRAETMQVIFSGSKGLVAICLLILIDRGELDLEAPVARYWPEFAAAGKKAVTVRQIATHTARLPALAAPITIDDLGDDRRLAEILAAQPQDQDPRAGSVYHALTYGWLCGELIRRIDGRSVGRFFAEEVAGPLGLELHIGLPAELEPRVARQLLASDWDANGRYQARDGDRLRAAVWGNPVLWSAEALPWNRAELHRAEIPGAGAIGTARSVAILYGRLEQLLSPSALRLGTTLLEEREEPLLGEPQAFGVGFQLQTATMPLGPPFDAFGHNGAGGSCHGRWPRQQVGFSYAMNLMKDGPEADLRAVGLLDCLYRCLEARALEERVVLSTSARGER